MKTIPFDIDKAKAGARVVTRDGKPVRILCYDANFDNEKIVKNIVGIVGSDVLEWPDKGNFLYNPTITYSHRNDLMIQEEPKYVPFTKETVPLLQVVTDNKIDSRFVIVAATKHTCFLGGKGWVNYADLLRYYTFFEDGSPCGTLAN